ncbi:hypothetical protein ACMBCN_01445 [Candidatus Liberibacter asiaticus]
MPTKNFQTPFPAAILIIICNLNPIKDDRPLALQEVLIKSKKQTEQLPD